MSIYYKYASDGTKQYVLSYVDEFVYWYTSKRYWKMVYGCSIGNIACEIIGIFTLVHVNQDLTNE